MRRVLSLLAGIREWILRIRGAYRGVRDDDDIRRELAEHLRIAEEELRRMGHPAREAARLARVRCGNPVRAMEAMRAQRGVPHLSTFGLDARLGVRMLRNNWALTVIGGLAMAAGITVGASIFELVHVLRTTSVPLAEGDRVVVVQPFDREAGERLSSSPADFERWRTGLRYLEDVGAFRTPSMGRNLNVEDGPAVPVTVAEMSSSGFTMARVQPLIGRFLLPDDEAAGAAPVIVIGYDAWRSTFAAAPDVVGQVVALDGVSHTVVGVMPEGFAFPRDHQYWTALSIGPPNRVVVFGRLAPGATVESAGAEVEAMGLAADQVAEIAQTVAPRVVPYVIGLAGEPASGVLMLLPFALPLLLVPPCSNIAILTYARTVGRQGEFAARTALGASRGRIVGQVFIEALILAAGATGVALLLTPKLVDFIRSNLFIGRLPFWMDFGLSYTTIAFGAVLAVVAAVIAGAIPAFRATGRLNLSCLQALGAGSGPKLGRVWTTLVLLQVALSVAILPIGAQIAWALSGPAVDGPRFMAHEYLTARLAMDPRAVADPVRYASLRDELVRRLTAEPGVAGVTVAAALPSHERREQIQIESPDSPGSIETAAFNRVDGAYFETFGIGLLAGRGFEPTDAAQAGNAVLVNRTFARHMWGDDNPLGRRLRTIERGAGAGGSPVPADGAGPWLEVVGVVEDFSAAGGYRTFYRPAPPVPETTSGAASPAARAAPVSLVIHAGPSVPAALPGRVREIAASLDQELRVDRLYRLDDVYESFWIQDPTLASGLAGLLSGLVAFSMASIYTLMAFAVTRRQREIGIRSALGAPTRRLIADVFRSVLVPVTLGVALGGLAALLLEYYWAPVLFDFREGGRPLPWILPASSRLR